MDRADVALITPYPRVGTRHGGMSGVASYAHNLAHALSDSGARVEVVAPLDPGERPRRETDAGVGITRAFSRTSTGTATAVRTALRTGAPVVHLQHEFFLYGGPASTPGLACGLRVLRQRRRRAVATLRTSGGSSSRPVMGTDPCTAATIPAGFVGPTAPWPRR
jgi:hypothetical protein